MKTLPTATMAMALLLGGIATAQADEFLTKPFRAKALATTVSRVIEKRKGGT